MIGSSQINEKIETDLVETLRISWNELLDSDKQEWTAAALLRILADGDEK